MKFIRLKIYAFVFLLALTVIAILPSSFRVEAAEHNTIEFHTYYPENVLDYTNLHGISEISATQDDIAYTLDKTTLNIFNKSTKTYAQITGFNNIKDLKYIDDTTLLVVDGDYVRIIRDLDTTTASNLDRISDINLSGLSAIDIYTDSTTIYIGLIRNSIFELYKYNNTLSPTQTNPIKQTTNSLFDTAYNIAISDSHAYILFKNSENKQRICSIDYNTETALTPEEIIDNVQLIDCFYHGNEEYIVAFTKETLHLFKTSDNNYKESTKLFNNLEISDIMDIDCYGNIIYTSDSKYENIQTYEIVKNNSTTELKTVDVLLCSFGSQPGRFNDIKNIHSQGSTLYVSDSKNNRVQIINDNDIDVIDDLEIDSYPRSIITDTYQNIYFIKNRPSKSILARYSHNGDDYNSREYSSIDGTDIGLVSDITITNANIVFLLDYTNDTLLYLTQSGLQEKTNLLSRYGINLDENSKIEYIRAIDALVILNNNILYLLDTEGVRLDTISHTATDITSDVNALITLNNNEITLIGIDNDQFTDEKVTINNAKFTDYSTINYDILGRKMYAFDTESQSINYFEIELQSNPLQYTDYNDIETLPLALNVLYNANIYDYPYGIGNAYSGITECIGIETVENNYYRVIFNHNNTFKIGYLKTYEANVVTFDHTEYTRVITTNKQVPIYKYPTILRDNGSIVTNGTLSINKSILISKNHFPISIDGKKFYLYTRDNKYGFIFNADVVLDDNRTISYLNVENAQIQSISSDTVIVYDEDLTTTLITLNDGDRIYVDKYDKHQEYTKIIYKDKNLNSIEGYVKTNCIKMDKLDNSKIVLIIIIVISVVLLGIIVISYITIKKKK